MNDQQKLNETLSALLDGEAGKIDQLELRRLVRALEEDPDLIETYQRYNLVQAALRGKPVSAYTGTLVANVSAALDGTTMDDLKDVPPPVTARHSWLRDLGRVAIAASVAVIAVYAVQVQSPVEHSADVPKAAVALQQVAPQPTAASNRVFSPDVLSVSAGDRPFVAPPAAGEINPELALPAQADPVAEQSSDCVVRAWRANAGKPVWEKDLSEGYVLCRQNSQTQQCESVTSRIGCYSR